MKKIGIVICNFNKVDKVLECIQCILENKFTDYDLYVVDNASTDGAPEAIKEKYGDKVRLIVNKENLGGSGGFNTGLRAAYKEGYEYLMCVDNDAMLDENAIGNLYEFLEEHDEVGMAASKIYHLEAPDYIQQFGQTIDFEYFCTDVPHLDMYEDGSMPDYLYVDSVAACSLMIRRSTIDKIGFMPEENFLYWDDTEWCYLCNKSGMKVLNSMFQIVYEGLHNGEYNRAKTVMLAYDDAIHGITGKAGENRIFELDFNEKLFRELFESADSFYINENEHSVMAERVRILAKNFGYDIKWCEKAAAGVKEIVICDNIFDIDDLSGEKIYIDINDCILRTEDDMLDVINYNYSKRSFVFANKPVFMQKVRELRKQDA